MGLQGLAMAGRAILTLAGRDGLLPERLRYALHADHLTEAAE